MPSTSPTLPYYPKGRRAHLNAKLEEWKANRKSTRNNMLEASGKRGQRRRDMAAIEAKYASMRPSVHFTSENAARAIANEKKRYKNRRTRRRQWFSPVGLGQWYQSYANGKLLPEWRRDLPDGSSIVKQGWSKPWVHLLFSSTSSLSCFIKSCTSLSCSSYLFLNFS